MDGVTWTAVGEVMSILQAFVLFGSGCHVMTLLWVQVTLGVNPFHVDWAALMATGPLSEMFLFVLFVV